MTEWKPTEQNIGQPVLDTYSASVQNTNYIGPQGTLYIGEWYDVDTSKLISAKDIAELLTALEMKVSPTSKNFDKVKKFLNIPEKPKTLDEIQQEFDEKIDKLIETTKWKFAYSKEGAEKLYNTKFDRIIKDFEYAKEHGEFPPYAKLTYGTGLSTNPYAETSFVIKQGNNHEGYYTIGNRRYFRYYMNEKPNRLVRFFMRTCLGFFWVDDAL